TLSFWLGAQVEWSIRFRPGEWNILPFEYPFSFIYGKTFLVGGVAPMRFLPVFLDLASGTVALVGSGSAALNKLRLLRAAGAHVRWYSSTADVAEEVLLASPPTGRLELSFADPVQAAFSEFVAVACAEGW